MAADRLPDSTESHFWRETTEPRDEDRPAPPPPVSAGVCPGCGMPGAAYSTHVCVPVPAAVSPAEPPEDRSETAKKMGHEGMVTVWDSEGRYAGCMGVNVWQRLLRERELRDA